MKNCQNVKRDGLSDPVHLTAFRLRAGGATWQECADQCNVSMNTVRSWGRSKEWAQEVDIFIDEVRTHVRMMGSDAAGKAIKTLLKLMDSPDEDVALKAASRVLDWFNADGMVAPQVTQEAQPVSDAEAAKLLSSAQSLPDLPAGAES